MKWLKLKLDDKIEHNDEVTKEQLDSLKYKLEDDITNVMDQLTCGLNKMRNTLLDETKEMRQIQEKENEARKQENATALKQEI